MLIGEIWQYEFQRQAKLLRCLSCRHLVRLACEDAVHAHLHQNAQVGEQVQPADALDVAVAGFAQLED